MTLIQAGTHNNLTSTCTVTTRRYRAITKMEYKNEKQNFVGTFMGDDKRHPEQRIFSQSFWCSSAPIRFTSSALLHT